MRTKDDKKKSCRCRTCLPWNNIAVGGDSFYYASNYPFTLATFCELAFGGEPIFLGFSLPSLCIAIPTGLICAVVLVEMVFYNNTSIQESEESARESEESESENAPLLADKTSVPELAGYSTDDTAGSGNEDAIRMRSVPKQLKISPEYTWYEKWVFLPGEHLANWIDYFSSPFLIYQLATSKNILWAIATVTIGSQIYATFCSMATTLNTRDTTLTHHRELRRGALKKIKPLSWVTIILGEGVGGFSSYFYTPAQLLDFIAQAFGGFEIAGLGLSKYAIGFGIIPGLWCTFSVMYCRSIYYKVNQEEPGKDLVPLNCIQKCKTPFAFLGYTMDSTSNTVFVALLIAKGRLSRTGQLALLASTLALGAATAIVPTQSVTHTYRLFNTRARKQIEDKEKASSKTDGPGFQSSAYFASKM